MSTEASAMSRRKFLVNVAYLGAALLLNPPPAEAQTSKAPPVPSNEPQVPAQVKDKPGVEEPSLLKTATEALIVNTGIGVVNQMATKMGLPVLSKEKQNKREVRENPGKVLVDAVVLAPLIEEALCRLIPSQYLSDASKNRRWEVGIPISLAFAVVHNFSEDIPGERRFVTDKFPLAYFCAGAYFWELMRRRGYWHAVIAHATANAEAFVALRTFYRSSPDKYEPPTPSS